MFDTVSQTRADTVTAPPPEPAAVEADRLSKTFRLPHQRFSTLKERALHPLERRTFDELRAVDDVSLQVRRGEFFGIVGRNGSGKSTLLKCLAGIYRVDAGHAIVRGRLSPFIELGVGFSPELTARENVLINGIMLGLTRREARRRFDAIIAFAELEDFLDLKLKNYSSGMNVRLAFSTAIQVDADVLLIDEVLAVGDAAFQQKCLEEFERLKAAGRTIVFVTHDMRAVERFCDRAMLLERGRLVAIDEPRRIARAYNELNFGRLQDGRVAGTREGDHLSAEIKDAWFERSDGRRVTTLAQDEPLTLCAEIAFHDDVRDPLIALHLRNEARHTLFATSTDMRGIPTGLYAPGDAVTVRVALENWLAPGRYDLTPTVARADRGYLVLDLREDVASLMVHGELETGGAIDIPHTWRLERG